MHFILSPPSFPLPSFLRRSTLLGFFIYDAQISLDLLYTPPPPSLFPPKSILFVHKFGVILDTIPLYVQTSYMEAPLLRITPPPPPPSPRPSSMPEQRSAVHTHSARGERRNPSLNSLDSGLIQSVIISLPLLQSLAGVH